MTTDVAPPATAPKHRQATNRLLRVGLAALVVAAAFVGGCFSFLAWSEWRLEAARARWSASSLDVDELAARPPAAANDSAVELERLAAAVGIDLVPKGIERPRPVAEAPADRTWPWVPGEPATALRAWEETRAWLDRTLRLADDRIPEPPAVLVAFLDENRAAWAAIRRHLHERPLPTWESDLGEDSSPVLPNLLGLLRLHHYLLAEALVARREGRTTDAVDSFASAWRVTEAVESRFVPGHLVFAAASLRDAIAVRKLGDLPVRPWRERLLGRPQGARLVAARRSEAVLASVLAASTDETGAAAGEPSPDLDPATRAFRRLARPVSTATLLDRLHAHVEAVEGDPARPSVAVAEGIDATALPPWDLLSPFAVTNHTSLALRSWLPGIEAELSAKVLTLRAKQGDIDAGWSASRCSGARYEATALSTGGWRVAYVGPVPGASLRNDDLRHFPLVHVVASPGRSEDGARRLRRVAQVLPVTDAPSRGAAKPVEVAAVTRVTQAITRVLTSVIFVLLGGPLLAAALVLALRWVIGRRPRWRRTLGTALLALTGSVLAVPLLRVPVVMSLGRGDLPELLALVLGYGAAVAARPSRRKAPRLSEGPRAPRRSRDGDPTLPAPVRSGAGRFPRELSGRLCRSQGVRQLASGLCIQASRRAAGGNP